MTPPSSSDSSDSRRSGVPPFDPLKVIGEVQRQAMDSAGRVISQFLDLANGTTAPGSGAGPGPEAGNFQKVRADMGRAVDLYVDLFQRTFETYADLTESTLRQQRRGPSLHGEDETSPLALTVRAGGTAEAKVWLHNLTDQPTVPARVTVTVLAAHGGARIEADRVTVDPPELPAVAPDGSTAAVVRIDLTNDQQDQQPPGRYFGHLLTPDAALPLRLTVEPVG